LAYVFYTKILHETWIPSDTPAAIQLDAAPPGYEVVHRHRVSSTDKRGGGVAFIHCQTIKATTVDVGDYTEVESLAVKFVCRQSKSLIVVCVYRPPGAGTSTFTDQLSDLLDQLLTFNIKFVVVGDFNVPGCDTAAVQLDRRVVDVFEQYSLNMSAVQHTPVATCSTSSYPWKTKRPVHRPTGLLRCCTVGLLVRPPPADVPSWRATDSTSYDRPHLSVAPPH